MKAFGQIAARLGRLRRDDSGVVMLETVLVFPIQLLVMMAIIQIAHIYVAANVLQYAAYQGTRTAAVNLRGRNGKDAQARGARAAWVVASTLNNQGKGSARMRVPENNYVFPAYRPHGEERITFSASAVGSAASAETVIYGEVACWFDLVVPVGGPFVYMALSATDHDVRIDPETGMGQVRMEANARIPKVWPH